MAGPLGKLTAVLGLDAREFDQGIDKAQGKVGGFGNAAKVGFGIAAGAAAVGFGLMAKGADEMETAQGRFQAATGRSSEEAAQFARDMNDLVGNANTVGRSFEEIHDAGIAVAQQLGLTGDAGKEMTNQFLAFQKLNPGASVRDVGDALKAFDLPAERATGLMDQLVASSQKYGTSAGPETLSALQGMAPALSAMGMGLDDGIGLLNLFQTAGLDASSAQRALNTAVSNLPPGENLNDVIARLAAIEDPAERAQAAIDIFGTKAGVGLANAIKPGMTGLDDYIITQEDAVGASQEASDALVNTSDKIKMFFERRIADLRGLGAEFGPLVSGFGAVISGLGPVIAKAGPGLTKAISGMLSGAWGAAQKVAGAAIGAAGAAAGGIYSAAVGAIGALGSALSAMWARLKTNRAVTLAVGAAGAAAGAIYGAAVAAASAFANAIAALWHALPGNARITGALTTAGTKMGTMMGGAMAAAIPLALIGIGVVIAKVVGDELAQALRKLREDIDWELVPPENVQQIRDAGGAVEHYGNAVGLLVPFLRDAGQETVALGRDMQDLGEDATDTAEALRRMPDEWLDISQLNEDFSRGGASAATSFASHFDSSLTSELGNTGERIPGVIASHMQAQGWEFAAAQGRQLMSDFARGMAEESRSVVTTLDDLRWILENGLSPEDRAAVVLEKGGEWIKLWRQGMESDIPGARESAHKVGVEGITALAEANKLGTPRGSDRLGEIVTEMYAHGITSQTLLATLAAEGVNREALIEIGKTAGWNEAGVDDALAYVNGISSREQAAGNAGRDINSTAARNAGNTAPWVTAAKNVSYAWIDTFVSEIRAGKRRADAALSAFGGSYRGLSPPKEGPLRHIDDWGENVAQAWWKPFVGEILSGIGAGKSALSRWGQVLGQSMSGPIVQLAYAGTTAAASAATAAGGGVVVNINGPFFGNRAWVDELVREIDERVRLKRRGSGF